MGEATKIGWTTSTFNEPARWRVFCCSLADVFDNEVPEAWRADLWQLIADTPFLDWLLVTKRIGNVPRMVPEGWLAGFPSNVRLLISVVNQAEADRDVPRLLALPCKNGISYEPALEAVDWLPWLAPTFIPTWKRGYQPSEEDWRAALALAKGGARQMGKRFIDWLIIGGESAQGASARPFDLKWATRTIGQCRATSVPVFVKQLGSNVVRGDIKDWAVKHAAGAELAEWPEALRVQEFPA